MKTQQILDFEQVQNSQIMLTKEGLFWRAYEQSAYLLKNHFWQDIKGIPFLGCVIYPYHTVANRRNRANFLSSNLQDKQNYIGFLMHHNSYKVLKS